MGYFKNYWNYTRYTVKKIRRLRENDSFMDVAFGTVELGGLLFLGITGIIIFEFVLPFPLMRNIFLFCFIPIILWTQLKLDRIDNKLFKEYVKKNRCKICQC